METEETGVTPLWASQDNFTSVELVEGEHEVALRLCNAARCVTAPVKDIIDLIWNLPNEPTPTSE